MERIDAVVVGARLAGCAVATPLARAGRRVLVLDRMRFPSDQLSTHVLMPAGTSELAKLGALPRILSLSPSRVRYIHVEAEGISLAPGVTDAYLAGTGGVTRYYAVSALIGGHPTLESSLVAASASGGITPPGLPELGRCVSAPTKKVGKTTVYTGAYTDTKCAKASPTKAGKYEWSSGPGPAKHFTATLGATTLETVGEWARSPTASTAARRSSRRSSTGCHRTTTPSASRIPPARAVGRCHLRHWTAAHARTSSGG
jgi:hypothetical protein